MPVERLLFPAIYRMYMYCMYIRMCVGTCVYTVCGCVLYTLCICMYVHTYMYLLGLIFGTYILHTLQAILALPIQWTPTYPNTLGPRGGRICETFR